MKIKTIIIEYKDNKIVRTEYEEPILSEEAYHDMAAEFMIDQGLLPPREEE